MNTENVMHALDMLGQGMLGIIALFVVLMQRFGGGK